MKEFRPYDAKDNDINKMIKEVIIRYCKRHDEEIDSMEIYEMAVDAKTVSGREIIGNVTCGMELKQDYIYLKEVINGKQKRIKKSEW